jgi:hypothetical protein
MGAPAVPPVIPQPFANNNPSLRNTIPNTTSTPGVASWDQGWPSDTMQPVVAGGVPPFGQDFNGLEFALSSHDYYIQAGALFPFQSAVATAIGGYGVGALLGSVSDPDVVWFNTVTNNSTDPDSSGTTGWVSLFAYGFDTHNSLTGGITPLTLTNIQATRKFIVLNGTLTGNLVVNFPSSVLKDWLIINNTSGSFTTTARSSTGGASVSVPQGGWANPLGVYSDGTNMYPTVAPLGVPIAQAATPLTLVERTNNGYVLATYFNSDINADNLSIANVYTDFGDDYIRKNTLANFESQLLLQNLGGAVTAGQVPLAAVIQYAANILSNAALTGTPTTPTASVGTATTQVASTAFAAGTTALAGSNGAGTQSSFTLPNGIIVKFGQTGFFSGSSFNVVFSNPFPTIGYIAAPFGVATTNQVNSAGAPSTGGFTINGGSSGITCMWIAIGK